MVLVLLSTLTASRRAANARGRTVQSSKSADVALTSSILENATMTFLQQIKLRCPVCDTRFESLVAKITKLPSGRRSDFREEGSGEWLP